MSVCSRNLGWDCWGIRDGYNGLFLPELYPDGDGLVHLTPEAVRGITHLGGTMLGTTNTGNPMKYPVKQADGSMAEVDRTDELIDGWQTAECRWVSAHGALPRPWTGRGP